MYKLEIFEPHAKVIREIYNLVYEKGYCGGSIVQYLNKKAKTEDHFKSSTGGKWNTGVVNFILRNPFYKGYTTYVKRRYKDDKFSAQSQDTWILSCFVSFTALLL